MPALSKAPQRYLALRAQPTWRISIPLGPSMCAHAAALVWDTLYGIDATLQSRQMIESEEVSADGLTGPFAQTD